jgi:hypothetical protein
MGIRRGASKGEPFAATVVNKFFPPDDGKPHAALYVAGGCFAVTNSTKKLVLQHLLLNQQFDSLILISRPSISVGQKNFLINDYISCRAAAASNDGHLTARRIASKDKSAV